MIVDFRGYCVSLLRSDEKTQTVLYMLGSETGLSRKKWGLRVSRFYFFKVFSDFCYVASGARLFLRTILSGLRSLYSASAETAV